jgi:hypothetical protein
MAVQPKCSICGGDLMGNEGKDADGKIIEPQVSYWAHDPRNLHVDVLVTAHTVCVDKIKITYPNFDKPVQDYAISKYPTIDKTGKVVLKSPTDFIKKEII